VGRRCSSPESNRNLSTRAFAFVIALAYAISDLNSVLSIQSSFPITGIYLQATGSSAGAVGLTCIIFLAYLSAVPDTYIASGRTFWALSRDKATPFSNYFAKVSPRWDNPMRANVLCAVVTTCVGCIYVGNTTAFNAFVGSFVVLTTISYGIPIAAHLLTRRKSVLPGPFHLGRWGWPINVLSLLYIIFSDILFCFPFVQPVTAANMNYVCVIVGGFLTFVTCWWLFRARNDYEGPVSEERLNAGRAPYTDRFQNRNIFPKSSKDNNLQTLCNLGAPRLPPLAPTRSPKHWVHIEDGDS
jgi:amino acid transporter